MARKRMIDPSFWTDEKLGNCSIQERYLFMGLVSNADDEGYGRANPKLLKSLIFPYDDLRASDLENWLSRLGGLKLIVLYGVDEQTYYYLPNFTKHQTINKPTKSSFPKPTDLLREDYGSTTVALPPKRKEEKRREEKRKENNKKENSPAGSGSNCPSNIFTIWENINARPITGFEAERLQDLENIFSTQWIVDAMSEAGKAGKRNLRYVEGILNNWQSDGRNSKQSKKESFVEMAQRLQAEQEASNSESDRNGQSDGGIKTGLRQGNTRRTGGIKSVAESLSQLGLPNNK